MLGRKRVQAVDRDALVAAALRIIESEGLLSVTAERIGREVGVAAGQVAGVDAVVAEAYRELSAQELATVRRTILAHPSPAEQMRALLSWLAQAPEDGDAVRIEAYALARHNPELREAVQEGEAAWHGLVASVVRRGARGGEFPESDAEEVAAHIISLVDGINAYQLIGYRSDLDRMRLLTRVVQAELGLVWGPELATALR